jgi:hypothetical protein
MLDSKNPTFTLLKATFPKNFNFSEYKVFYITSFEATEENIVLMQSQYKLPTFIQAVKDLSYNSHADDIGIYYLEQIDNGSGKIYVVTDPLELFQKEKIITSFDYNINEDDKLLPNVERIF